MTIPVSVTVNGTQNIDGELYATKTCANGSYISDNGIYKLEYTEHEEGQMTVTKVTVSQTEVTILRQGATEGKMIFVPGKMTKTSYQTPMGQLDFEIDTVFGNLEVHDDGMRLELQYGLFSSGSVVSVNSLIIVAMTSEAEAEARRYEREH